MNHRLDELFVRAGGQFGHYGEPILPDIEKFAELIVQECMKLNHEHFNDEDPYSIDSLYRYHFGFKE